MSRTNKIFDLAFAFDENYLVPFYVLLTSIFKNNSKNLFRIHVIATGINRNEKNKIEVYVRNYKSEIIFYDVDGELVRKFAVINESRYPISVYYRLFFPDLISKSIEKILYLDIDTIVIGNLSGLLNLELGGQPIAVALDAEYLRPDIGISEKGKYFNSGVMLINLKLWRKLDLTQKSIQFLSRYPEKAKYHDQDALNVLLKDNWFELDVKYNLTYQFLPKKWLSNAKFHYFLSHKSRPLLIRKQFDKYLKNKIIIHFNHKFKPWLIGSYHPLKYLFNDYFILFSKHSLGELLISENFKFQFVYLIIKLFELEGNDLQTRILLAISLHIHWFMFNIIEKNSLSNLNILREYYLSYNLVEEGVNYRKFDVEFERNKEILNNIFLEIIESEFDLESDFYVLLGKWKNICKDEILRLNRIDGKNNLIKIPELVNIQFGIYGLPRSLLFHFLFRIIKDRALDKI